MKIDLNLDKHYCRITREPRDKPVYKSQHPTDPDSFLLLLVKRILNRQQNYDLIKKRMCKDGHLTDNIQQYLRSRNITNADSFCIYWNNWAISNAIDTYRENRTVILTITMLND